MRLRAGVAIVLSGDLTEPDIEHLKAQTDILAKQCEADVRANDFDEKMIEKYQRSFHTAIGQLLQTSYVAFDDFLEKPDASISESSRVAAMTALPHLLEEAYRETRLANFIFDVGPYWSIGQAKTEKSAEGA